MGNEQLQTSVLWEFETSSHCLAFYLQQFLSWSLFLYVMALKFYQEVVRITEVPRRSAGLSFQTCPGTSHRCQRWDSEAAEPMGCAVTPKEGSRVGDPCRPVPTSDH